jgi:hypothetical protein
LPFYQDDLANCTDHLFSFLINWTKAEGSGFATAAIAATILTYCVKLNVLDGPRNRTGVIPRRPATRGVPNVSSEGAARTNAYPSTDLSHWRTLGFINPKII